MDGPNEMKFLHNIEHTHEIYSYKFHGKPDKQSAGIAPALSGVRIFFSRIIAKVNLICIVCAFPGSPK
jgi:hypothetical protein